MVYLHSIAIVGVLCASSNTLLYPYIRTLQAPTLLQVVVAVGYRHPQLLHLKDSTAYELWSMEGPTRRSSDKKLIEKSRTTHSPTRRSSHWRDTSSAYKTLSWLISLDIRALKMDLYIDGYVAQTVGPEDAARYFVRLLGVDAQSLRPAISEQPLHAFFITDSAMQTVRPSLAIDGRSLDYAITDAGTVVPQRMWHSGNPADAQRYANVSLNMPVFFVQCDQATLGLTLLEAVKGGSDRGTLKLLGARNAAPIGNGHTIYVRINVSISLSTIARFV